jgi:hypothetical protein
MKTGPYDPRYLAGIELFNQGEYYDSHDVWEDLWADYRGPDRAFYQGLIQTAVALYHLTSRNLRGARRMFFSSRGYLAPYPSVHQGIELARLLQDMQMCFSPVLDNVTEQGTPAIHHGSVPRIHWQSALGQRGHSENAG